MSTPRVRIKLVVGVVAAAMGYSATAAAAPCGTDWRGLSEIIRKRTGNAFAVVNTTLVDFVLVAKVKSIRDSPEETNLHPERRSPPPRPLPPGHLIDIEVAGNLCGDYRRKRARVLHEARWNQYDLPKVGDDVVVLVSHTNEKDKAQGSPEVLKNAELYPFGGRLTWQAPDRTRCSGRRCPNPKDESAEAPERPKPLPLPPGESMCDGVRLGEACESVGQRCYLSTGTTGGSSCESSGPTLLVCSGVPAPRVHCGAIP